MFVKAGTAVRLEPNTLAEPPEWQLEHLASPGDPVKPALPLLLSGEKPVVNEKLNKMNRLNVISL